MNATIDADYSKAFSEEDHIMTISEKIQLEVQKSLDEKRLSEIGRLGEQLEKDRESIEKVLKLIHESLLYKKIESSYSSVKKYEIVTEDIFLQDYTEECKGYWSKGVIWTDEYTMSKYPWSEIVKVNGNRYYDIRCFVRAYESDIGRLKEEIGYLLKKLHESENKYKELCENFPAVVKMMNVWAEKNPEFNGI